MDKIIAIADCNNFYVSCERLFDPKLSSSPTVVLTNNDGSVISRSPEAKSLGVAKGANFFNLRDLVHKKGIRCFSSNYTLYADISERVFSVLKSEVPTVEIYSIDEVFMDLTHLKAEEITNFLIHLRQKVLKETGIPISIGAASTKTLAKLANKVSKATDGAYFMQDSTSFLRDYHLQFKLDDIWGIGNRSQEKLIGLGCENIMDFINYDSNIIRKKLTVTGLRTQLELRGIRCYEVETGFKQRKNISTSRTFGYALSDLAQLQKATHFYVQKSVSKLQKEGMLAQGFVLFVCNDKHKEKIYYAESFKISLVRPTQDESEIWSQVQKVLVKNYKRGIRYRKSAVCLVDLIPKEKIQGLLFEDLVSPEHYEEPSATDWIMRRDYLSKKYTSNWKEIPTVSKIEDF